METKKAEPKTEVKKEILTIASVFQNLAQKGAKDRKDLADKIITYLKSKGIAKNVRGHEIKQERVLQQISAMIRDIKLNEGKGRGFETQSWWSTFNVVEDDKIIKLVLKH